MFEGVLTAMVTPFRDGQLDEKRLRAQVEEQIQGGVDGLVPVGTTGESPTLSHDEHRRVVEIVVEAADGRVSVVAGTGSNATSEALDLTEHAHRVGADGALVVTPYYNKPTQEGIYRHFQAISDAVELPLVLYNIPGRTGVTVTPETIERLTKSSRVTAVKEATASMDQASEIATRCGATILAGDDSLTMPLMAVGGRGVISVLANLVPARMAQMVGAGLAGDFETARNAHLTLFPLFRGMFLETNPIPIKTAMGLCTDDTGEMRLPLCEMGGDNAADLRKRLEAAGLL